MLRPPRDPAARLFPASLLVPFIRQLFRFGPRHADDLTVTVVVGGLTIAILEAMKPGSRNPTSARHARRVRARCLEQAMPSRSPPLNRWIGSTTAAGSA